MDIKNKKQLVAYLNELANTRKLTIYNPKTQKVSYVNKVNSVGGPKSELRIFIENEKNVMLTKKIVKTLKEQDWHISNTADALGINRQLLYSLMEKNNIRKDKKTIQEVKQRKGERLQKVLEKSNWNKAEAARRLGVCAKTIFRKIKEYDLKPKKRTLGSR